MKLQSLLFSATAFTVIGVVEGFIPIATSRLRCDNSFGIQQQTTSLAGTPEGYEYALLFDCDGVILETEEFHRLAYNAAFKSADLTIDGEPVEWSVAYYGECHIRNYCSYSVTLVVVVGYHCTCIAHSFFA